MTDDQNIEVNSISHKLNIPSDTPLLWAIREELNLTGTKFGCGKGLCGACTVWVDDSPIRSCITPVGSVQGKNITTIEGLKDNKNFQAITQAWDDLNVPQCGYCQPGQIMSATALLQSDTSINDQSISDHMSGNLCRCGTYPRIKKAIHQANQNK